MKTIDLLDGTTEWQNVLEQKAVNDNYYYGELNTKALSSSAIKLLVDSPKKYHFVNKYGNAETQGLRDGRLLHTFILEPEKFDKFHFVDVASKNTKAYKLAVEEHGSAYTSKEKKDCERLADALLRNEAALQYLNGGAYEVPKVDTINGIPFRGKADILTPKKGICDIKTTTDIKAFRYSANKYCYDVQCYIYCELFNCTHEEFTFLVLDKSSLDIGIFKCSEEFYLRGKEKTELGIQRYLEFISNNFDLDNYYIQETL